MLAFLRLSHPIRKNMITLSVLKRIGSNHLFPVNAVQGYGMCSASSTQRTRFLSFAATVVHAAMGCLNSVMQIKN